MGKLTPLDIKRMPFYIPKNNNEDIDDDMEMDDAKSENESLIFHMDSSHHSVSHTPNNQTKNYYSP